MSRNLSDEKILLKGLRARQDEAFVHIYNECHDVVNMLVTTNSGSEQDAEDVYNEGIFGLIELVDKPDFEIRARISTLFISICRNQWLLVLSKRKSARNFHSNITHDYYDDLIDEKIDKEIYNNILWISFNKLKKDCKIILRGYLQGMTVKEIAGLMGFTPGYLKKKKHYCHRALIKMVSDHPDYIKIKETKEIINF